MYFKWLATKVMLLHTLATLVAVTWIMIAYGNAILSTFFVLLWLMTLVIWAEFRATIANC